MDEREVGHKTFRNEDGTFRHEPLYESEANALWEQIKAAKAEREELMPDEETAIKVMMDAYQRLKDLGWSNPVYCPKDGSVFKVLELGSTGKHDCIYRGEWPEGGWWILEGGDIWPSRPALFKPKERKRNESD